MEGIVKVKSAISSQEWSKENSNELEVVQDY